MILNAKNILALLEDIASTSSKLDKERLLREFPQPEELKFVLTWALDPTITFGVKALPIRLTADAGSDEFHPGVEQMLKDLSTRQLSGSAALNEIAYTFNVLSVEAAELLKRILLKDLRAGFAENTVNKVFKGLIPDFPYMRCSLPKDVKLEEWPWAGGVFSQEKADGTFANLDIDSAGQLTLSTRQGSILPAEPFNELLDEAKRLLKPGYRITGELLVMGADDKIMPRKIGNGILNSVLKGGAFPEDNFPVYQAWDMVPLDQAVPKGTWDKQYRHRFAALAELVTARSDTIHVQLIQTDVVFSMKEAYDHYAEKLAEGKEGTVLKHPFGTWRDGTSKDQVKLKLEVDLDLRIKAINEGRKNTKNEGRPGAFAVESQCGQLKTDVTIKNEALRARVEANPGEFIEKIIVVRANSLMKPSASNSLHSLFLPRMVEADYRTDKSEADDLARVIAQFENAIKEAA